MGLTSVAPVGGHQHPGGRAVVDGHLLPVADAALDAMSRTEAPGYRAAVRIS